MRKARIIFRETKDKFGFRFVPELFDRFIVPNEHLYTNGQILIKAHIYFPMNKSFRSSTINYVLSCM